MKLKHLYLILTVIGFAGPSWFFISFLVVHGLDVSAFARQLFGIQISSFFAVDLLLASVVFVIFVRREARRCTIRHWWTYVAALLTVGLSFALPLFLYVRESRLERLRAN